MSFFAGGDALYRRALLFCLCAVLLAASVGIIEAQHQAGSIAAEYAQVGAEATGAGMAYADDKDYSLKIVFSDLSGRNLTGISLRISDEKGNEILKVAETGPVFLAKLVPGTYNLELTYRGESKFIAGIKISGKEKKEVYLYWN